MRLWRVSLRSLARKKLRTGFTLLAVALGVASTFAVVSLVENTRRTIEQFYQIALGNYMFALDSFYSILYVVGFLGIFISAFILFNSLYVSVVERKREFAVMKTIGYSPGQIVGSVMREVLLLAAAGTLIGAALGYVLAVQLQELMYSLLKMKNPPAIEIGYPAALSITAGMALSVLAGLLPALYACRVSVIQVLRRQSADKQEHRRWLTLSGMACLLLGIAMIQRYIAFIPLFAGAALLFPQFLAMGRGLLERINRLLFGFEGAIAARSAYRRLNRTAMTAAILSFGIALMLVVSFYKVSFEFGVHQLAKQSMGGDFSVPLRNAQEDLQFLRSHPDIEAVALMKTSRAFWEDASIGHSFQMHTVVEGFPTFTAPGRELAEVFEQLEAPGTIALGQSLFKLWGGQVGGKVSLLTATGFHEFEVVSVVTTLRSLSFAAFISSKHEAAIFGPSSTAEVLVRQVKAADQPALLQAIRQHYQNRIRQIYEIDRLMEEMENVTKEPIAMIQTLFVLAVAITGLGLINTLLMSVMERTREIGMMRSVASTRSQIVRMVLGEGFVIGLAGVAGGVFMGTVIAWLTSALGKELAAMKLQFVYPWHTMGLCIAYGLLLSLLAALLPAAHALRIRLTEAVKYD